MWAKYRPGASRPKGFSGFSAGAAGAELSSGSSKQLPQHPGMGEPGLWVGLAASQLMVAHLRGLLLGGPSHLLQLLL